VTAAPPQIYLTSRSVEQVCRDGWAAKVLLEPFLCFPSLAAIQEQVQLTASSYGTRACTAIKRRYRTGRSMVTQISEENAYGCPTKGFLFLILLIVHVSDSLALGWVEEGFRICFPQSFDAASLHRHRSLNRTGRVVVAVDW
jgi:hypothetical protein